MHRLRNMTARRALLLAMPVAALILLIVGFASLLHERWETPGQNETAAVQNGAADRTEENPIERKSVLRPKEKPVESLPFENGKLVPDGYKWRDPHPWLVSVRGERYRRYIGPQTAEAIFAVYDSPYTTGEKAEKLLAHWKRVLARGAVVNDYKDALKLGFSLMNELANLRIRPDLHRSRFDLSADAPIEEIEKTLITYRIRTRPIKKEQFSHAAKTGEGTLNVTLFSDGYGGGGMGISTVRAGGSRRSSDLTDREWRNIRLYGTAPKGFRLRLIDEDDNELPFDKFPSFNERDAVKRLSKANLGQLLFALPSYLIQPDAQERSTAAWMRMMNRYDAALAELADRGQVPMPAAVPGEAPGAAKPLEPMVDWGDPDPRRKSVAEAYMSALEKQAKKANISEAARAQISRRLQELRALMLGPAGTPVKPPPDQDGGEDEKE
ncbi:MAG: hypothetical protein OXT69_10255 [Candidatus Poribacteria bacterium]|nr:hypothetical protein [Candidatus Poribacteria bacterium]